MSLLDPLLQSGGGHTILVDGIAQTQRVKLNLKAGTNVALTPADVPGSNETDITIAVPSAGLPAPLEGDAGGVAFATFTGVGGLAYAVGPGSGDYVLTWDPVGEEPVWTPRGGLAINAFAPANSLVETSQVVANPAFTAGYNATPTIASLTNNADAENANVSATPTSFASAHTFTKTTPNQSVTFTLTAQLGPLTSTRNATITWAQKNFWGISTTPANTEAFVESLATSALATTQAAAFTVNATGSNKIYFAHPTRYGTPTFTVGGFAGGFTLRSSTISVTNAQGFTENYSLWESDSSGLGSTTVGVS